MELPDMLKPELRKSRLVYQSASLPQRPWPDGHPATVVGWMKNSSSRSEYRVLRSMADDPDDIDQLFELPNHLLEALILIGSGARFDCDRYRRSACRECLPC